MSDTDAVLLVRHDTEYEYSSQVAVAQHLAYLQPVNARGQEVSDFRLEIAPAPGRLNHGRDVFGNHRAFFSLTRPHRALLVRMQARVRLQARFAQLDLAHSMPWDEVRTGLRYVAGAPFREASEFTFDSPYVLRDGALRDYAGPSFPTGVGVLAGALDLMRRIHRDFRYEAGSTDVTTTVLEAFEARAGVCQDFSHIMIGCLRSLGLAARYVSGYLHTQPRFAALAAPNAGADPAAAAAAGAAPAPAPLARLPTPVIGADASHAWVAVHCPRLGWVEFDPTNDAIPGTGHVRLATGRDYGDVAPLRGVVQGGGEHRLRVAVSLTAD